MENYDVVIVGAGPAGLSAGLYVGRAQLNALLIEKEWDGGQIAITSEVENYPGCLPDETGMSLAERMTNQVEKFGVHRAMDLIESVDFSGNIKVLKGEKAEYYAKTVIVATGASPRPIGCVGEKEFIGNGVSYCATCDGNFFKGLEIFVVGGGDTAIEEALYLTKFGRKVTVIHRRDTLRAAKYLQKRAFQHHKMEFIWDSVVEEIKGDGVVQGLIMKNIKTGEKTERIADAKDGSFGVFGFIGYEPQSKCFEGVLDMENGYVRTNEQMATNIPGVFAAGDIRVKNLRQVVTACADGAIAAVMAEKWIDG